MFLGNELGKIEEIKAILKSNECMDALFLFNQMLVQCAHVETFRERFSTYLNTIDSSVCFNAVVADFRSLYINDNVFHAISNSLYDALNEFEKMNNKD